MSHSERKQTSPLHQIAQKRKRESGPQDDVHELEEPQKKRFIKNAKLNHDVHPRPSTSAAASTDDQTTWKGETAPGEPVALEKNLPSTLRAVKIAKKREREAEQEEELEPDLEERYIANAVVIPKLRPRPASFAATASGTTSISDSLKEQNLLIHNLSVSEYQSLYHSVVDRKLVTSTGQPQYYSVELGRSIKQRLWEMLRCPSFIEEEQVHNSEHICYTENFVTPTLKSFVPCYDLDISNEPNLSS